MKDSIKKIIMAICIVIVTLGTFSITSDATINVDGVTIPTIAKISFNGNRLKKITYDGVTVWEFGAKVNYHSADAVDASIDSVTDFDKVDNYTPTKTASSTGNRTFYGWSKGNKATALSEKITSTPLTEETTDLYAIYVHRHTGSEIDGTGCYAGGETYEEPSGEVHPCNGTLHYQREEGGDYIYTCDGEVSHEFRVSASSVDPTMYEGANCYNNTGATVGGGTVTKHYLNCGKTAGTDIETW